MSLIFKNGPRPVNKLSLKTSGHVKAHPIPGIYSNTVMYIYVYSRRAGAEHPLGTKFYQLNMCRTYSNISILCP